ncbi:hypothetical protein OX284_014875 [Flavobacterium sp. SUN046]|uniref:hypothetical protein n=1 Tax=Flavobacterium sp. SUN046 TaxID=3002440 RepID=UPI002DB5D901|nr:hypothetical protein [Flavobacterium sp. SUN046]MEC4050720.1 hypothetical protein [Flavobacterium sp. SUN046]
MGQVVPKKEDSTKVYREIEKYSKRKKFTKFLHKLIFEPVAKQAVSKHAYQKVIKSNYRPYQCKIIRKITITTLDPFGYSEEDTTKVPSRYWNKVGNGMHIKTSKFAIRNLLLIKKNQELDSLLVKETERLIRSQGYVRGVSVKPILISKESDSVDISIRVLDSWSLVPDFSTSTSTSVFRLTERNFIGSGHEFSGTIRQSLNSSDKAFSSSYSIPSFFQTFIRTTLSYQNDIQGQYSKYINVERPFFSAFTRWAGGVYVDQQYRLVSLTNSQQVTALLDYKYNSQDYWAGHSFQIFKGNTESLRTTNLFTIARFMNKNYLQQPNIAFDSLRVFSGEKQYLFNIGVSSRKYIRDRYLLNYNTQQDVASGFIYSLTSAYQRKNQIGRLYLGGRFALGKYYSFGYLSTNIEYGTFFRNTISQQSALTISAVYFTNLIETGVWKFRQFIKPQIIIGTNRMKTSLDRVSLNAPFGIQGFSSSDLLGTKRVMVNFQTQAYSPWNVYGFRLNPYLSYSMGMLSGNDNTFKTSRAYSEVGVGVIISNDYLVFNSFQFSFSFFPNIPGYGDNVFKTNSLRSNDFTLPNFEVTKPAVVSYQ